MSVTKRLRDDHAELEDLVRAFQQMLARDVPPSGIELIEFRQTMSRQILAHLHFEDVWLYPQLLKSNQQYVAVMARAFMHEMGGLLDAYKAWALRWPTERALSDWEKFGVETRGILDAIVVRIKHEDSKLYPLVENIPEEHVTS